MRCYTFYVTALINVRVLSSSSTGCWRSLSMSYSSSLGLVETSCSGSAWYVKNYCFHKSKNLVGFMRRGGNDFLSVTIDLWSRPPVAVISARAAINYLGKPAKAKCVWARTVVRRLIKSSHQMLVKGRLAKLMIYFLQLILMYVYTMEDFGSLRLTKCTAITIPRTLFQYWFYHRVTKISLPPPSPWVSKGHGWTAFVPT